MLIIKYLKSKLVFIIMLLIFICVFALIFFLYRLPVFVVSYAACICLLIGIIFMICDYIKFSKKHFELSNVKAILKDIQNLPFPDNLIEQDYHSIICRATEEILKTELHDMQKRNAMTEYYTIWVHQIKTPIAAMRLILQTEDTEISRELEAQLFITEQYADMVLAYLRCGSSNTDYIFKEYKLDNIVRQAARKYAAMFIRKKIALELMPIDAAVITDEKWLCFVIEQIISNAIKYTSKGSVTIYTEEGPVLVIRDTGIGIAATDLPRIFEQSYTGENGHIDKHSSGIGLYLSKMILTRLGHTISVESKPSIGTVVRIGLINHSTIHE